MRFDVVTIFPETIAAAFAEGVVGRAVEKGLVDLRCHDLRNHAEGRHRQVDDAPFGGGAGMVLMAEPVYGAVRSLQPANPGPVVFMEPWGRQLDQELAASLGREPGLIVVCGRYEGIDDRVREELGALEISIGPYVLSGGELPAMVLIDAVARLLPGVLGAAESLAQDTFGPRGGGWPQYTRPADWRGRTVPEVLVSGDHPAVDRWRRNHARRAPGAAAGPASPAQLTVESMR